MGYKNSRETVLKHPTIREAAAMLRDKWWGVKPWKRKKRVAV
ncbi:hypothetical protein LCGC14_0767850 [marine sediment metagenome]|uniref:Uncharacterized protein n=1 Tax=marine sediment metagenome TaxID=412755 RepID=A0A0F9PZC7_9ZZZZ